MAKALVATALNKVAWSATVRTVAHNLALKSAKTTAKHSVSASWVSGWLVKCVTLNPRKVSAGIVLSHAKVATKKAAHSHALLIVKLSAWLSVSASKVLALWLSKEVTVKVL